MLFRSADVDAWPKLFQNLRASRETELVEQFPLQAACAWIGNSQAVAMKHYLMVRDEHFAEASGNAGVAAGRLNPNRDGGGAKGGSATIGNRWNQG